MAGNLNHCMMLLQDNNESVKSEAEEVLLKLCGCILKNPQELRYRKINLASPFVSTKLLPASGAIECLFEAGFIEEDDGFLLPIDASLAGVRKLYSLLNKNVPKSDNNQTSPEAPVNNLKQLIPSPQPSTTPKEYVKRGFFEELKEHLERVLRYEDPTLQNKVKLILPLEKLQIAAMTKLREIQRQVKINKAGDEDLVFEDLLLSELLEWFKNKFFKWIDSPECKNCKGECSFYRAINSSNPQISRIEVHRCKSCGCENQFPRYTDPEPLLYTRQGRCGEWANCFTLICRTVGFDARLVYDKTDHVWTEIWSVAQNRWVHADPCENVMDRPLMYEKGWGKKLSYIIAFSQDEIQDVTWRYTRSYREVMKRRNLCSEHSLTLFISQMNSIHQNRNGYSIARKKFVTKRYAFDLAKLLIAPPGCKKPGEEGENESDYGGRTSGSLAWRLSRGETNDKHEPVQWNIPEEVMNFELTYSIVDDVYTTKDTSRDKVLETVRGWQKGIEIMEGGIFRKEEQDWKMVYLVRSQGSEKGKLTWTIVLGDSANVCVEWVSLQAKTATFHGATVKWDIEGVIRSDDGTKEECKIVCNLNSENFETKDLKGAIKISLSATVSGGQGDTAWQHAQLFRQSLKDPNLKESSMIIRIGLLKRILT